MKQKLKRTIVIETILSNFQIIQQSEQPITIPSTQMEVKNQDTSDSDDVADEAQEKQVDKLEIPTANATSCDDRENEIDTEAGPSNQSSTTENTDSKAPVKRNYRRRTESGDGSSSDSVVAEPAAPTVENTAEDQPVADASESEDVSLDELRVSGSEQENNGSASR